MFDEFLGQKLEDLTAKLVSKETFEEELEDISEALEIATDHLKETKSEIKKLASSALKKEDIDKLKPKDGSDGKTPTTSELLNLIEPLIPQPIQGEKGEQGEKGDAGSPDTPEQIK